MGISLAIFWHQHQPYYKDLTTGEMVLPWVRLHGVKDYYGMARLVQEFPELKININLVPSMLTQLIDYVEQDATDPWLEKSRLPADGLSEADVEFILDHFFMAQWDRMIRVYPRFKELLDLRRFGRRPAKRAADDFGIRDLRDLQVWFNLAWFHPVSFEELPALRELRAKGKHFTESDKEEVLRLQHEVLAQVIPLHRKLMEAGQLELTTTPFYHPILPLLCDMDSARVAMPHVTLPDGHHPNTVDAERQVAKAVRFHEKIFGVKPRGMWPAEGSVSPAIVPLLQEHGIEWFATDEEILAESTKTALRGGFGKLLRPDLLYRPWQIQAGSFKLHAIFRDHQLSDLIGFQYQSWDGQGAAEDFVSRIAQTGHGSHEQRLVSVILDGENCWEHYHEQGIVFLRALYGKLALGAHGVRSTRISDYLDHHPPHESHRIEHLYSGSWINHDFYIWIGHPEDRKAWEYLFRVREDLQRETLRRGVETESDRALAQAWEELYIAEGSDWFWWYGDDRTSGNDEAFDRLFRTHLKNVYKFLGLNAPYFLDDPVASSGRAGRYTAPRAILHIVLDGRASGYFEWLGAGRYDPDKEGGVMAASTQGLIQQIYFGYDVDHLFLRIDLRDEPRSRWADPSSGSIRSLAILFAQPHETKLHIEPGPPMSLQHSGGWFEKVDGAEVVWDEVVEIKIPFGSLGLARGEELAFYIEAEGRSGMKERLPRSCALQFPIPPQDIEAHDWMA